MDTQIQIEIVDGQYIIAHWDLIKTMLLRSFDQAEFNSGYTIDDVVNEVQKSTENDLTLHILAIKNKKIIGSIFSLEKNIDAADIYYDVGWLVTDADLLPKERIDIASTMIEEAHTLLRSMKYKYVYTEIGTKQGMALLVKKFHYTKHPDNDYWVKEL